MATATAEVAARSIEGEVFTLALKQVLSRGRPITYA